MTLKFSSSDRVLIFAPHPDDESLATGGLIQHAVRAGAKIRVVFATDGDNNPWPQRFMERRLQVGGKDRARWGRRRRQEALAAMARLGLKANCARFLALPDQGITGLLLRADESALFAVWAEIEEWHPTVCLVPSNRDVHPDHSALFVFIRLALTRMENERPMAVWRYVVHAAKYGGVSTRGRAVVHLNDTEITVKREAILCHESQMVLSRKRFTDYARTKEIFHAISPAAESVREHPIGRAWIARGALQLHVQLRRETRGSFAGSTILLALESVTEGSIRWILPLPARSACATLEDARTGAPLRRAAVRIAKRSASISIPIAPLQPLQQIFVKLKRRSLMYDEAGWREVACAAEFAEREAPNPAESASQLEAASPDANPDRRG